MFSPSFMAGSKSAVTAKYLTGNVLGSIAMPTTAVNRLRGITMINGNLIVANWQTRVIYVHNGINPWVPGDTSFTINEGGDIIALGSIGNNLITVTNGGPLRIYTGTSNVLIKEVTPPRGASGVTTDNNGNLMILNGILGINYVSVMSGTTDSVSFEYALEDYTNIGIVWDGFNLIDLNTDGAKVYEGQTDVSLQYFYYGNLIGTGGQIMRDICFDGTNYYASEDQDPLIWILETTDIAPP